MLPYGSDSILAPSAGRRELLKEGSRSLWLFKAGDPVEIRHSLRMLSPHRGRVPSSDRPSMSFAHRSARRPSWEAGCWSGSSLSPWALRSGTRRHTIPTDQDSGESR